MCSEAQPQKLSYSYLPELFDDVFAVFQHKEKGLYLVG